MNEEISAFWHLFEVIDTLNFASIKVLLSYTHLAQPDSFFICNQTYLRSTLYAALRKLMFVLRL